VLSHLTIVNDPIPLYPPSPSKGEGGRIIIRGTSSLLNTHFASLYFIRGRESINKRGGFAPSLKFFPPLLEKERGIKGVRLVRIRGIRFL